MTQSTAQSLRELAGRVERATGPARELDAEIMFDLYAKPVGRREDGGPCGYLWPEDNASWNFGLRFPDSSREKIIEARRRNHGETLIIERDGAPVLMNDLRIPLLTASLDAAMSLVPEGWSVQQITHPDEAWADVYLLADAVTNNGVTLDRPIIKRYESNCCATPALALCAAALRSLAAGEG